MATTEQTAHKAAWHVALATAFCAAIVALFGVTMAPLLALVHAPGFFGGLGLWLARPMAASWRRIKVPYVVAILAILVHRIDEGVSGFLPAMEELTGQQTAAMTSPGSILLVVLALAWLVSPLLMRIGHPLGYFGAWSLFAAFGLVEPWHFVFPFLAGGSYGYFPGMVTAPLIIAAGWWGMWRMWQETGRTRIETGVKDSQPAAH